MKWGKRKGATGGRDASGRLRPGQPTPTSHDHNKARKLKKKKASQLSNAELKKLNERLQLETQFAQLQQKQGNKVTKGADTAKKILAVAKTANEVYMLANSPVAKAVRSAIK